MIHVGSPLLISAWFIQPLLLHSATTEVIHCAMPCFPLIRTGAPSSAGTGTDYVSSCFCSVSVYVSSRFCFARGLVILSINILCYVDVAYSYTLQATVLPLKLFLTST